MIAVFARSDVPTQGSFCLRRTTRLARSKRWSLQTSPAGAGRRILFVEDDPSVRQLVGEVLEELGFEGVEASGPDYAIEVLHSSLFLTSSSPTSAFPA